MYRVSDADFDGFEPSKSIASVMWFSTCGNTSVDTSRVMEIAKSKSAVSGLISTRPAVSRLAALNSAAAPCFLQEFCQDDNSWSRCKPAPLPTRNDIEEIFQGDCTASVVAMANIAKTSKVLSNFKHYEYRRG